jgi:hypothetical protein
MSLSRFTAKKPTKNIGEEESTNAENPKHPPVPSITPLLTPILVLLNDTNIGPGCSKQWIKVSTGQI